MPDQPMTQYIAVTPQDVKGRTNAIKLYGPEGSRMRRAGQMTARVLDLLTEQVRPGVTTQELDDFARLAIEAEGGVAANIGYKGYAHASCISINQVVCHGIPGDKVLKDGDILNIDLTSLVDGWHGDTSRMFLVGDVPLKARRLVDVTYECMMRGIEKAGPATGWATSATRSRAMPKSTVTAWYAISWGMAWGWSIMTRPTCCITAARAPAPS
jgi:methionyl aminopeptidase